MVVAVDLPLAEARLPRLERERLRELELERLLLELPLVRAAQAAVGERLASTHFPSATPAKP